MMRLFLIILFINIMITLSCKKSIQPISPDKPDDKTPEIHLSSAHEAGVNEIWLKVDLKETEFPASFVLERNGNFYKQFILNSADTIIADDRLPVSTTFTYRAAFTDAGLNSDSSEAVVLTTKDSTTHDYTWERFEFGTGISDNLSDVAIIDENNIWAVGSLEAQDSAGQTQSYNAVHWNGSEWEYVAFIKENGYPISSIRGMGVISQEKFWLAAGSIYLWNDSIAILSYQRNINSSETVENLWMRNNNDVFAVGNAGLIVHYNGTDWQKMNSGTEIDLVDVWGSFDGEAVWACGRSSGGFESILLKYNGSEWETVWGKNGNNNNLPYNGTVTSVWLHDGWEKSFVVGSYGLYRQSTSINRDVFQQTDRSVIPVIPKKIRGTAPNNVFFVGEFAMIMHYNGSSFRLYEELYNPDSYDKLYSVDINGNIIVAVGIYGGFPIRGLILKGRRLNN